MSVTVITGAGGGMGRACVERFRGGRLLLVDIDDRALEGARELAPGAECAVADLGSRASIDALVRQVEAVGGLDRLVHLAGVSPMMDDRRGSSRSIWWERRPSSTASSLPPERAPSRSASPRSPRT